MGAVAFVTGVKQLTSSGRKRDRSHGLLNPPARERLCSTFSQTVSEESNCTSDFSRIEGEVGAKGRLGLLLSGGGGRGDFQEVSLELILREILSK